MLLMNFLFPEYVLGQEFFDSTFNSFEEINNFQNTFDTFEEQNFNTDEFDEDEDFDFTQTTDSGYVFSETTTTDFDFNNVNVDVFREDVFVDWSNMMALDGGDMEDMQEKEIHASSLLPENAFQYYDAVFSNQKCLDFYVEYCNSYTKNNPDKTTFRDNLFTWRNSVSSFSLDSTGGTTTKYTPAQKSTHLEEIYTVCSNLNTLGEKDPKTYDNIFKTKLSTQNTECLSVFGFPVPESIQKEEDLKTSLLIAQSFSKDNTYCDLSGQGFLDHLLLGIKDSVPQQSLGSWLLGIFTGQTFLNISLMLIEMVAHLIIDIIGGVFMLIAGGLVMLARWLGNTVPEFVHPNKFFMSLSGLSGYTVNNDLVVYVWTLIRNISNVFIVFALIFIAIMIMFKKSEYTTFLSLVYLIIVALLINFTLVLCGIAIDISNFLTFVLLSHGNLLQLGDAYSVMLHSLYTNSCLAISNSYIQLIGSSLITIIVGLILITVMVGLFVMLVLRMLMLWFYAALSPAAAVSYILPKTREYFDKWLKGFMTQLTSLPILAGALTLVNIITVYIVNIMTASLQQNTDGKGVIILFTIVVVVAINAYLLTIFNNLQKGTFTAKILGAIKFPDSAKSFFSSIGRVGAGAATGLVGAGLTGKAGRTLVGNLTSFKRNQSRWSKRGTKFGNMMAGLNANINNFVGDKLQGVIDNRDAKLTEPIDNVSSNKMFSRLLNKLAFKPSYRQAEIKSIVEKALDLLSNNDLGLEAEQEALNIIKRAEKANVVTDEGLKKKIKKIKGAAMFSNDEKYMGAKTKQEKRDALEDIVKNLETKEIKDIKAINFKSLGELLGADIIELAKQLKNTQNVHPDKINAFIDAAYEHEDKVFEKLIMAGDDNNVAGKFKIFKDALKKRKYNKKDYDSYMADGMNILNDYVSAFEPGSKERQSMENMINDIKNLQNAGKEQDAFNKMIQFYQMYDLKKEHNARTYMSAANTWAHLMGRDNTFQKNFDAIFLSKAPGAQKIDTKDNLANTAAQFANLIKDGNFQANDNYLLDSLFSTSLYDPNIKTDKREQLFGNFKDIQTFYTNYYKKLPDGKNKSLRGLLMSLMLLNSGLYNSPSQRPLITEFLVDAFNIKDGVPLAQLFQRLSNIGEADPGVNKFLSQFAVNYRSKINFTEKFEDAKKAVPKGKKNKGLKLSYGIKKAFNIK